MSVVLKDQANQVSASNHLISSQLTAVRKSNPNNMRNALLSVGTIGKNSSKQNSLSRKYKVMPIFAQTSRANLFAGAIASGSIDAGQLGLPSIINMRPQHLIQDQDNISSQKYFSNPTSAQTHRRSSRNMHLVPSGKALDAASEEYYATSENAKMQFYNRIQHNKAIITPKEDLLPAACQLDMPCFTIIEEPLNPKRKCKDRPSGSQQNKDNGTEITSKIMRMSVMHLMWNVTETSLKFMNKKITKTGATNVRKYKGGFNEKLNQQKKSPKKLDEILEEGKNKFEPINEDRFVGSKILSPIAKDEQFSPVQHSKMSEHNKEADLIQLPEFAELDDQPSLVEGSKLSIITEKVEPKKNTSNQKLPSITQRKTILTDQEKYRNKLNNDEYHKLKGVVQIQADLQDKVHFYKSMLNSYEGQMSAKPKYKFNQLGEKIQRLNARHQQFDQSAHYASQMHDQFSY